MKHTILLAILILTLFTCKNKSVDPCVCEGTINCTEEYRSIIVEVADSSGKPYVLDEFKTTKIEDGKEIILRSDEFTDIRKSMGMYLLMNDGHKSLTEKCGKSFRFTGWKDGKEVISKNYVIAHDCCHILVKEGDLKITIN
ncbi:MAG TPA: hypothetical protein VGN64_15540 [Dyadobacter sp.]|jgi:hypothetical protein|nr:hypothetical protein [Dyadobacter sp.]